MVLTSTELQCLTMRLARLETKPSLKPRSRGWGRVCFGVHWVTSDGKGLNGDGARVGHGRLAGFG